MQIIIRHQLSFAVGASGQRSVQQLLLTPLNSPVQTIKSWTIGVEGFKDAAEFIDAFGNRAHLVSQTLPEGDLMIAVAGLVETHDRNGVLGRLAHDPVPALFKRVTPLTEADPSLLAGFEPGTRDRIGLLHALMARVREAHGLRDDDEDDVPPPPRQSQSQTMGAGGQWQSQGGSIVDTPAPGTETAAIDASALAHAFIGAARALDIPARYITGYLAADDDGPAAFHAWAEAYDGNLGWIGFDAALGLCPTERHVRLAAGLDASFTRPIRVVPAGEDEPKTLTVEVEQAQ